jgi:hypothetical protein
MFSAAASSLAMIQVSVTSTPKAEGFSPTVLTIPSMVCANFGFCISRFDRLTQPAASVISSSTTALRNAVSPQTWAKMLKVLDRAAGIGMVEGLPAQGREQVGQ